MNVVLSLIMFIRRIAHRYTEDEVAAYSGSVCFWLLISIIPLLMLTVSLLQHIPILDEQNVRTMISGVLPDVEMLNKLVESVLDNIYVKGSGAIISISAVLTLWSASTATYRLQLAVRKIYGNMEKRNYVIKRAEGLFYTLLLIIALIISLVFMVLGNWIAGLLSSHFPRVTGLISIFLSFKTFLSFGIVLFFMLLIYRFMPGAGLGSNVIFPGAFFVSLSWNLASYGFSFYFTYLKNISYMYGSLGALILLMFWLYLVISIILIGAEINAELFSEKQ